MYWIAHYLFPHEHLRPMHTPEQMQQLSWWIAIARNAFWWYPFERICFVCDRALTINKDERGRLHSLNGPSVTFSDGWQLYHTHGVEVPGDIIDDPASITTERIDGETNAEVRRVMIEMVTPERYLAESDATRVHEDTYGVLWSKQLANDEPLVMVEVTNATAEADGSHKRYWLRVDPNAYGGAARQIAQAAVASTWRDDDGRLLFADWRDYAPVQES